VLVALRAATGTRRPHRLTHPPRARRVRLGSVARLRRARGARARGAACAGDARHRRGTGPCAVAPCHQPGLAAPAAGHLRGPAPHHSLKAGIVLFAHGSRDPQWARPFEALAATLSRKFDGPVKLAYLELMQPSLEQAIAAMVSEGAKTIRVVPVF